MEIIPESFVKQLNTLHEYLSINCHPQIPLTKTRYIVNFTKGTMLIFCLLLITFSQNFTLRSFLYLSIHGSYGILWLLKEFYFADKSFNREITVGSAVNTSIVLFLYYLIPYVAICYDFERDITYSRIIVVIIFYAVGVFYMLCSDAQKNFTLLIKKGLISNGLFFNTRNPNYFGEILIYLSFGMIAESWGIYFMLVCVWVIMFGMRMLIKDVLSLKKKEGAEEYFKKSYLLFPKIFENDLKNLAFYGILSLFCMCFVKTEF